MEIDYALEVLSSINTIAKSSVIYKRSKGINTQLGEEIAIEVYDTVLAFCKSRLMMEEANDKNNDNAH